MIRLLKFIGYLVLVLVLGVTGLVVWSTSKTNAAIHEPRAFAPIGLDVGKADVALGERIVMIRNGCVDCHGKDLGGGPVVDDPVMGKIWATNITPTTLQAWSDEEIAQAIRNGVGRDKRLLILMPSHDYQHLSREDLAAVVAYLRKLPAVDRVTPPIKLGPLANTLFALGKLPTLLPAHSVISPSATFVRKPAEAPTLEFGKYLVSSSCTGCHGPSLAGGPIPGGPPSWAPAKDLRVLSKNNWTYASFFTAMREGKNPQGEPFKIPMPVALTKQLNDVEIKAMWTYLESVQAR